MTAQPMQHKRKLIVNCFVVGAVIVAALVLAWRASGREHIPGVTQWPAGPCVVDWHAKRGALVSACPRQNMTRLWALPLYDDLIDWPDARTLLRLERTFTNKRTGTKSVELDYAFSSLGLDQITAADFLAVWRAHWHIENKLHWVRDVTLNGDASRVRRGNAPQVLAAIRNTLITAARRAGFTNIAEALRAFARSAFRAALASSALVKNGLTLLQIRVIDNQNVLTYTLIIQNVLVNLVPITIRDVAKRLNLSITTVSRALDGYDDVAKATRQRVIRTAREMGYAPTHTARQLRRSRADAIGYILPTSDPRFTDPFFSEFIAGLGDETTLHNLDLMVSTAPPDKPAERQMYERWVHSRRVDGIVLSRMRTRDWRVRHLIKNKFPVVALGHTLLSIDLPYVEVDARAGFVLMVKHLVERGHKRIAYIGAPENLTLQVDRLAGFRDGLQTVGLTLDESLIVAGDLTRAGGYEATQRLLSLHEPPTAIMGANDLTAIGAMRAAHERGLVVGRDVAIAGYDGIEDGEHTHPPLTTLKRSVYDLARRLVNMLLTIIEGEPLTERQVMLPPELIVRGSTGG